MLGVCETMAQPVREWLRPNAVAGERLGSRPWRGHGREASKRMERWRDGEMARWRDGGMEGGMGIWLVQELGRSSGWEMPGGWSKMKLEVENGGEMPIEGRLKG